MNKNLLITSGLEDMDGMASNRDPDWEHSTEHKTPVLERTLVQSARARRHRRCTGAAAFSLHKGIQHDRGERDTSARYRIEFNDIFKENSENFCKAGKHSCLRWGKSHNSYNTMAKKTKNKGRFVTILTYSTI